MSNDVADSTGRPVRVIVGDAVVREVTLTVDTAIYADGDVLAETQEIPDALRMAGECAALYSLLVLDKDDQGVAFDLLFLRSNVSLGAAENVAVAITDTNAEEIIGRVSVDAGDYYDLVGCRVAAVPLADQAVPLLYASSGTSLWVAAVSRGAGTYASGKIMCKVGLVRN